ncbi:unnamed protein product [Schistocephalus solidus]|uniref:Uncharacterized protein n=1 Tax=Schistocephalus solidus TaxID=70667 RepID=A0A183SG63_SCHSO|nr:unnamed protein product [Schistocephalus solidus]
MDDPPCRPCALLSCSGSNDLAAVQAPGRWRGLFDVIVAPAAVGSFTYVRYLHLHLATLERLPKWSVLNCHDNNPHLPENLPRTASHDHPINLDAHLPSPPSFVSPLPPSHSGRDSLDENIPLLAVHLTSRASPTTPPVSAFARNPNPVGAMLEGICFTPVAVSGLTRPTVLKRESPDGAEQDMNSCFSEYEASHESPVFPNSSITKRSAGRPDSSDYSCKKSKATILVPSENSAFLPVHSSRIT